MLRCRELFLSKRYQKAAEKEEEAIIIMLANFKDSSNSCVILNNDYLYNAKH